TTALPGFRDFYPEDFALRARIFEVWRRVAARYGFEEYDGPPLEPLDLYTQKSGEEIVGQLYEFTDKGDRRVALRPEMTPSLARMVAARANGLKKPIRWFSIPQLFRYERQQRGRLKEHFQLNCDLIGDSSPLADAEIIALSIDVMRAFGLTERDVKVRLSDRRVLIAALKALGIRDDAHGAVFGVLDKVARTATDRSHGALTEAGLTTSQADTLLSLTTSRDWDRQIPDEQFLQVYDSLQKLHGAVDGMGLGAFVEIDLTIVRGLAYYTGTVFELFDAGRTLRAICGGGRYDNLTSAIGGVELGAVGFGMGDVVLGELLKEKGLVPAHAPSIDVFLAAITAEDMPELLKLAHELRDAGVRVEYALGAQQVGKQLKLADARNARYSVVIGPDDREKHQVILKDLRAKGQMPVPRAEIVTELRKRLAGADG
ncbi:MAG TPA: histidine--tRNA ligase, partial [Gemmatimonadales bacterium]|nr:histidine--tRNA ligase [Gemmatimonadales bacterium]